MASAASASRRGFQRSRSSHFNSTAEQALLAAIGALRVLRYVIHFAQWPDLDGNIDQPLLPPPAFPTGEGSWRTLTLTPAETAMKRRALAAYATQTLIIGGFLHAFMRPNELFLEGGIASPPACWCDDTHYATEPRPDRRRQLGQRR